jgi:hypothetical protein
MGELWNLRRATLVGSLAGLAALLLWPAHAFAASLRWPFVAALALTALAGASILAFILLDMATVRRSRRVRPARMFDVALGLALLAPAAVMLRELLG